MNIIENKKGQISYTLANHFTRVFITVQGGHLSASFRCGNQWIDPFFYAPWSKGGRKEDSDWILHVLRGDPFCLPFGSGKDLYQGKQYPHHGKTANGLWQYQSWDSDQQRKTLRLSQSLDYDEGEVEKNITLFEESPLVYDQHCIKNFFGKTSLGHHHIFHLPYPEKEAIIDMSDPLTGFSTPIPAYHPREGEGIETGYSWIQHDREINDWHKVPCIDGSCLDLSRFPIPKGYAEIVQFISNSKNDFCYSAISVPKKGFCYFQLKDPKVLASTMFWISNGGQYNFPSSDKVDSVLALEEMTGYFHFGRKKSVEKNPLSQQGYKTYVSLSDLVNINMIYGIFSIPENFQGIKNIIRKDNQTIEIIGKQGEKFDIPCRIHFLTQGTFE